MIIESKKEVKQTFVDKGGNIFEDQVISGFDYEVDSYVDHRELNDLIKNRTIAQWDCFKIIECGSTEKGDFITMLWRK